MAVTWVLMGTDYIFNSLRKTMILTMQINRAELEEHMIFYMLNFFPLFISAKFHTYENIVYYHD